MAKAQDPLNAVWRTMIARCENPGHNRYHRYGGRGISVCAEWRQSYESFRDWATSHGYRKGLQIDRRNTDGNYEPGNCRFTSSKENNQNRSNNRMITAFGLTKSLAAWADDPRCVVPYKVLWERLEDGFTFEKALSQLPRREGGYRMVTAFGETKSITEWVSDPRCNAGSVPTMWARINRNWPPERAISTPKRGKGVI